MSTPEGPRHPLDYLSDRHPEGSAAGGYQLVPNVGGLESDLYTFGEVQLRRATPAEVEELRFLVTYSHPMRDGKYRRSHPWESRVVASPNESGFTIRLEQLEPSELRYHVLSHSGAQYALSVISKGSILASGPEFQTGVWVDWGPMFGAGGGVDVERFRRLAWTDDSMFETVTDAHADDLASLLPALLALPSTDALLQALDQYIALRALEHRPLKVLGFFALLESMLAHKPQASDPYQAMGRQVRTKMALLSRRFDRPATHLQTAEQAFLKEAKGKNARDPFKSLWNALYEVRSLIAHGHVPDFSKDAETSQDPKIHPLGGLENVEIVVRDAVRSLLRQRLREPQLLKDLHEC
jgi:hypothetical protein